jgi:hypothetical protein
MVNIFEVTGYELNKTFSFKSLSGPLVSQTLYTFEMKAGTTEIHILNQVNPENFFKPTLNILEKRLKKQYRENLALLKNVLETSQVERTPQ